MTTFLALLPFGLKLLTLWMDMRGYSKEEKIAALKDFQAMQARPDQAVQAHIDALKVDQSMDEWEKAQAVKGTNENK